MSVPDEIAEAVAQAEDWNARVALIRQIPERCGTGVQAAVYARVAERVYMQPLQSEFGMVHWRADYELTGVQKAYDTAYQATQGFADVSRDHLVEVIREAPVTLRIFRLLVGLLVPEFVEACALAAQQFHLVPVSKSAIDTAEHAGRISSDAARTCATVVDLVMNRALFAAVPVPGALRLKIDKPDTARGWPTVQEYAAKGVPLAVLLHQRAYGGAFRQLLDATSSARGDLLEEPVEELFQKDRIPHFRTGAHDQAEIAQRFGLTVKPAPDFVVFDPPSGALRAVLECKVANDGGTARDKAARYRALRAEAQRLGGVPLFAVLGGRGWRRTRDALGPVVRDTDGRTFGLANLIEMLATEPFPGLRGLAEDGDTPPRA